VFSVASGHLYERFLRIMFLGVLRHTKSTVKFWLIENFLSPGFKVRGRADCATSAPICAHWALA